MLHEAGNHTASRESDERIMTAYWIGVASRDHVQLGVAGGFAQLGHGKRTALDRLKGGDRIVYYSPREHLGDGAPVQAFTAIGEIIDKPVYQATVKTRMMGDFHPFRRDVRFFKAQDAAIAPLLPKLSFTAGRTNWGFSFRRGTFPISAADYALIAKAMEVRDA